MMFRNAIKFLKDRGGSIAPIFAFSLHSGGRQRSAPAVDYTRANDVKAALQSALDFDDARRWRNPRRASLADDDLDTQRRKNISRRCSRTRTRRR